ncbi:acetyl-CoA hydrolase/transferase family protein [Ralstonia insidiosa]|uniref:acetyl-CoA hydrolase/transferase family protein n=1 Tax=Ralstonia TaxID=48736 RepID=UPI00066CAE20|nr:MULTISPECIES: acetyl-CoA hydrolase/transferase C-terminal domain-containing protein [Ralstonia]MBY4708124.1 acetyl-CoA hydrolase/transferase family protein [Ralstonia insidiosa]GAQ26504.1 acetyl-CoA hydrolase/transferase [Ralstonia sp. NT80]
MTREIDIRSLDFSEWIRPGDTVTWGQYAGEPVTLTRALMEQRHAIGGRFAAFIGATWTDTLHPDFADAIDFRSYCGTAGNRHLAEAGVLDILPVHYSAFEAALTNEPSRVEVLLLQVAGPDNEGRYSLSTSHEYLVPLIDTARVVIVEANEQAPWVHGKRMLHGSEIDIVVRTSRPLPDPPSMQPGAIEQSIARHVAERIDDGATIQCGIGTVPEAVLAGLSSHRDLGIHSGALGDAVAQLMRTGAVTNARKSIDRGVTVGGVLTGGPTLWAFAHQNPAIQLHATGYTHNAAVLASIDQLVAINSAIEVDLTGQINAECAGSRYLGAIGGALDFMRGANQSHGGQAIVVLPSRAGARSRIVAQLNGPVSTPRSDAAVIVTEHGVADLHGLTLSQRVDAMLAIAHPDDRDTLERAAATTVGAARRERIL